MPLYERLQRKWESVGIELAGSVEAPALDEFERRCQVRLPRDLREYLETVGGMAKGEMDEASLSFHGFGEMFGGLDAATLFAPPAKTAVLADFLIDSHLYVTPIDASGAKRPVYVACHDEDRWRAWPIADSFAGFIETYLADAESVAYPTNAWRTEGELLVRRGD